MSPLKKIVLVGGTGNLGRVILSKLTKVNGFQLRVLTRKDPAGPASADVEAVQVDYTSKDSLVGAIRGHDVVVNVLGVMAAQAHHAVLDAVIEAQVPRYYPANWGSYPPASGGAMPLLQAVPFLDTRRQIAQRVENAAVEGKLTFTTLQGGAWLENMLRLPVMFDLQKKEFYMQGPPDQDFSYSSKETCAEGLVNALQLPDDKTMNRHFELELFRVSQRRTLELLREAFPDTVFEEVAVDCDERLQRALQAMGRGAMTPESHGDFMSKVCLDPDAAPLPARNDNEVLGVKRATDEEFKQMLRDLQA